MNMTTDQGHFQKIINQIGNFLILITVLLVTTIFVYQVVKFRNTKQGDVLVILQDVLVLTVAAIPVSILFMFNILSKVSINHSFDCLKVGLPTVLSVTMAVGAKQLAGKKVIVKRLTAIEELASVSVLCSDKTGTMTLNELKFDEPWLSPRYKKSDILLYAYLCSEQSTNDAIEMAVVSAAKQGLDILKDHGDEHDVPGYKTKSFMPFNPSVKYSKSTVMNLETKETFQIAKGAPQVIAKLAGREDTTQVVTDLAKRGLRALGVARTIDNDLNKWELVGFISFLDPPRPDTQETIHKCKNLGVKIKMITGDQVIIAKEVAHRLGMGRVILDANHLIDPGKSLNEITAHCERADGFAQVTPEHKFKVVELLQKKGYLVGMTVRFQLTNLISVTILK
jgi:magnesium-transporting ATPase (P-type)